MVDKEDYWTARHWSLFH